MLELCYLGAAGWHLRSPHYSLLIDPYFTRLPLHSVLGNRRVAPDQQAIEAHTPPADGILISHPHYDHIMDVPEIVRITGALIYASPQSRKLLTLLGVPKQQVYSILPNDRLSLGDFKIEVHTSRHRRIFGRVPCQGPLTSDLEPPLRVRDYRMQRLYSFRISIGKKRITVTSGLDAEPTLGTDTLLVGADASREQLAPILSSMRPRLVFPNHWDDMFRPLSEPIRPMLIPPKGLLPSLERINLSTFADQVRALAPSAKVVIPQHFEVYTLNDD